MLFSQKSLLSIGVHIGFSRMIEKVFETEVIFAFGYCIGTNRAIIAVLIYLVMIFLPLTAFCKSRMVMIAKSNTRLKRHIMRALYRKRLKILIYGWEVDYLWMTCPTLVKVSRIFCLTIFCEFWPMPILWSTAPANPSWQEHRDAALCWPCSFGLGAACVSLDDEQISSLASSGCLWASNDLSTVSKLAQPYFCSNALMRPQSSHEVESQYY